MDEPEDPRDSAQPHWAVQLVRVLDDGLRVPGTELRIGFDGIIGMLVPVLGDASTAVGSLSLLWLALQRGVPRVVLARMAFNVLIDALLGSLPIVGDLFDFVWKANRMNLRLIERTQHQAARKSTLGDYLFVALFVVFALSAVALPFVLTGWLIAKLSHSSAHG